MQLLCRQYDATNAAAWIRFAELERMLGDFSRARAIFELAVEQEAIDMPELLWKAYIDFEFDEEEWDRTRELYERLLRKTSHVKVWVSFAQVSDVLCCSGALAEISGFSSRPMLVALLLPILSLTKMMRIPNRPIQKRWKLRLLEAWKRREPCSSVGTKISRTANSRKRYVESTVYVGGTKC